MGQRLAGRHVTPQRMHLQSHAQTPNTGERFDTKSNCSILLVRACSKCNSDQPVQSSSAAPSTFVPDEPNRMHLQCRPDSYRPSRQYNVTDEACLASLKFDQFCPCSMQMSALDAYKRPSVSFFVFQETDLPVSGLNSPSLPLLEMRILCMTSYADKWCAQSSMLTTGMDLDPPSSIWACLSS